MWNWNCITHHSHSVPKTLFIETERELVGIDFERLVVQPEWSPVSGPNSAPIYCRLNLLNLINGKIVVGMKHITFNSKVYLLGGEILKSGSSPSQNYVSKHPDSYVGSSNQVFRLSLDKGEFSLKPTSCIKRLYYGKCSPMVEEINGKIYALSDMSKIHNHRLDGTFEVIGTNEESGTILGDPPLYVSDPQRKIHGHFVLGNKFIVFEKKNDEEIDGYFYDTHARDGWKNLDQNVISSFMHVGLPIGGMCVPFFPQLRNNGMELFLSRKTITEGYALVINPSSGSLVAYQSLHEVFRNRFPLTSNKQRAHLNNGRNYFFMLPSNQICSIWVAFDDQRNLRLFTTKFKLELCFDPVARHSFAGPSHPIHKTFLKPLDICSWDCVVHDGAIAGHIFDAFLYRK